MHSSDESLLLMVNRVCLCLCSAHVFLMFHMWKAQPWEALPCGGGLVSDLLLVDAPLHPVEGLAVVTLPTEVNFDRPRFQRVCHHFGEYVEQLLERGEQNAASHIQMCVRYHDKDTHPGIGCFSWSTDSLWFEEREEGNGDVYLVLNTHVDSSQQPLLLFAQQAVNLPHGWEVQLIWGVKVQQLFILKSWIWKHTICPLEASQSSPKVVVIQSHCKENTLHNKNNCF